MEAMEGALAGRGARVVTWLPGEGKALRRVVLAADGAVVFASEGLASQRVSELAGQRVSGVASQLSAVEIASSSITDYLGERVFVEELWGPQRLFVLGAGDDAKPVVSMAALLGWSVVVADGRGQLARAERFPEAERVVALGDASVAELGIKAADAVVLMTHSYEQDRAMLAALLPVAPRYLGLLGARHRSSLLVSEAAVMTGLAVAECCERIHAPVGLDLGGDGPEPIALAVIAEAQAVCMGKLGASRRLTAEDVARHVSEGGASRYLQAQCAL